MTDVQSFVFKPFEEMTQADYAALGFKSGLEIHQQLLTRRKLFCRCPAGRYSQRVDAEILRHMRPTLSELGEYDGTALMEFKTKKEIVYLLNKETVCTYEMDDAPPFEPDPEAIEIALEIAQLLKLSLVNELHIARKQYLDGSIPTGFQRTTILGIDGAIEVEGKPIRIIQLGLEEDSCREVSDVGHRIVFRTDRLGMPLIEMVTYPDMFTPDDVARAAETLCRLVRATGKVRVGAGAAREDVNVSITGGTRIEIKGVPSIKRIPRLVYNEAMRQFNLLKIRDELAARGVTKDSLQWGHVIVTPLLKDTHYVPIRQAIERGGVVAAIKLVGFGGLLAHQTQEHTYFGQEFSDRVKVIACLMEQPNILHSDSTEVGISHGNWTRLRKRLRARKEDTLILVWGTEGDVETAVKEIYLRALDATMGVPAETRQALKDGTNGFERILPGADRMYPDTDEPPIPISDKLVALVKSRLPERPWDRAARYRALGLDPQAAELLSRTPEAPLFDAVQKTGISLSSLCALFLRDWPYFLRLGYDMDRLDAVTLTRIFRQVAAGTLYLEAVPYILRALLDAQKPDLEAACAAYSADPAAEARLTELVAEAKESQHSLISPLRAGRLNYYMGQILSRLRGRIPAALVRARLLEVIEGHDDESRRL